MKKILLLVVAVCMAVAVNAATPEEAQKKSKLQLEMENKRVGNTLTDKQKEKIMAVYVEFNLVDYPDAKARQAAVREVEQKFVALLTPEQEAARKQYFADMAARRAAAKNQ